MKIPPNPCTSARSFTIHLALHALLWFNWAQRVQSLRNITIDDADPSISYTDGQWILDPNDPSAAFTFENTHHYSNTSTAKATFIFTGVAIYYWGAKWPWGTANAINCSLSLDSGPQQLVDLTDYASPPAYWTVATVQSSIIWSATGLSNTAHTLVVSRVVPKGIWVTVDALTYTVEDETSSNPNSGPGPGSTTISSTNPGPTNGSPSTSKTSETVNSSGSPTSHNAANTTQTQTSSTTTDAAHGTTASNSTGQNTSQAPSSNHSNNTGTIVGAVCGTIALIAVVAGLVLCFRRRTTTSGRVEDKLLGHDSASDILIPRPFMTRIGLSALASAPSLDPLLSSKSHPPAPSSSGSSPDTPLSSNKLRTPGDTSPDSGGRGFNPPAPIEHLPFSDISEDTGLPAYDEVVGRSQQPAPPLHTRP